MHIRTDKIQESVAHGMNTGIRKGQAQNITCLCIRFGEDLPNTCRKDVGLPCTGAGNGKYRTFNGINSRCLSSI